VEAIGASKKDGERAKNMFALGLLCWMYGRPIELSETFIREKFGRKPDIAEANVLASAVFILAILLVLITQVGGEIRRRKLSVAA
jgi:hypothetical protein